MDKTENEFPISFQNLSRLAVGNIHAFINPVNKNLHVLMPASPAQSLHLYLKEMKGSTGGKVVILQDSIANRVVFDALYCYCKTKIVLGLLCQFVSLWAHKSEMSCAEKWLCKPCCNTATRD